MHQTTMLFITAFLNTQNNSGQTKYAGFTLKIKTILNSNDAIKSIRRPVDLKLGGCRRFRLLHFCIA